ncbi:hypothetical protein KKA01_02150 [Patescibacteria group bacterium]|nr:hypothetical protein [Patescibacteria group bacterium]
MNVECISIDQVLKDYGLEKTDDAYIPDDFIQAQIKLLPLIKEMLSDGKTIII